MKQSPVFHWGIYTWVDQEKLLVMLHVGDSFFNQLFFSKFFSVIYFGTCFESLRSLTLLTLHTLAPHLSLIPE